MQMRPPELQRSFDVDFICSLHYNAPRQHQNNNSRPFTPTIKLITLNSNLNSTPHFLPSIAAATRQYTHNKTRPIKLQSITLQSAGASKSALLYNPTVHPTTHPHRSGRACPPTPPARHAPTTILWIFEASYQHQSMLLLCILSINPPNQTALLMNTLKSNSMLLALPVSVCVFAQILLGPMFTLERFHCQDRINIEAEPSSSRNSIQRQHTKQRKI